MRPRRPPLGLGRRRCAGKLFSQPGLRFPAGSWAAGWGRPGRPEAAGFSSDAGWAESAAAAGAGYSKGKRSCLAFLTDRDPSWSVLRSTVWPWATGTPGGIDHRHADPLDFSSAFLNNRPTGPSPTSLPAAEVGNHQIGQLRTVEHVAQAFQQPLGGTTFSSWPWNRRAMIAA